VTGAMTARRVEVFFYGLFMDQDLLRKKGVGPVDPEVAWIDGLGLRIGKRAALVRSPQSRAYGVVMSLRPDDLTRLYSEAGLEAYRPEAVLAHLARGGMIAAVCYNLAKPPAPSERNSDYAAKLRVVARKVGLPADYIDSLQ
jgi:hypothetical protein